MSYINPQWIADEVANDVIVEDGVNDIIASYDEAVDNDIEILAAIHKLRVDEIPVDNDGYVTSRIMRKYGILLYKSYIFDGYWGSSDGDGEDIYEQKLMRVSAMISRLDNSITRESILGVFTEDGEPKGKISVIRQTPIGGRG